MSNHRLARNRRGQEQTWWTIIIPIVILIVAILTVIIYNNHVRKTNSTLTNTTICGGLMTAGTGVCKESCDRSREIILDEPSCKKVNKNFKCCIPTDDNIVDSALPPGSYGGNGDYDFSVDSMKVAGDGCRNEPSGTNNLICPSGKDTDLKVDIRVSNTKDKQIIVAAQPIVVADRNPKKTNIISVSASTVTANLDKDETGITSTVITISASEVSEFIDIYPRATCTTVECIKTNPDGTKGILRSNDDNSWRVKFSS